MTITDHARDHHARRNPRPKRLAAGATMIAAVATILAACGGGGNNQAGSSGPAGSPGRTATAAPGGAASATSSAPSSSSMAPAAGISQRDKHAIRALRTAAGKVPDGRAYDLETEHYQGTNVWDVKVASDHNKPYELYVSSDGRNVVHQSRHKSDDDTTKALKATIKFSDALKKAANREHGRLSEAEIDRDRGRIVWTATFTGSNGGEHEVIINAKNGKILRVKTENGGG
jgi:uncharacterized membrane protein YkoI